MDQELGPVERHPTAYKALRLMRASWGVVLLSSIALFMIGVFLTVSGDYFLKRWPVALLMILSVGLPAVIGLLYMSLISFFFARISLMQILVNVLFFGGCMAIVVTQGFAVRLVLLLVMATGLLGLVFTVLRQDPTGDNEMPHFMRRELSNRVREKIRRRERDARQTA